MGCLNLDLLVHDPLNGGDLCPPFVQPATDELADVVHVEQGHPGHGGNFRVDEMAYSPLTNQILAANNADVIVIAVKPQVVEDVVREIRDHEIGRAHV